MWPLSADPSDYNELETLNRNDLHIGLKLFIPYGGLNSNFYKPPPVCFEDLFTTSGFSMTRDRADPRSSSAAVTPLNWE